MKFFDQRKSFGAYGDLNDAWCAVSRVRQEKALKAAQESGAQASAVTPDVGEISPSKGKKASNSVINL